MSVKDYRRFDEHGDKHTYGPEFIRISAHDCFVCGKRGWWAHHVKTVGSGGRDAFNLVPVCYQHHGQVEAKGNEWFEWEHSCDLESMALMYGLSSPYLDEGE